MSLSKEAATAIVRSVSTDPTTFSRVDGFISKVIPDSWGVTGSVRNIGLIIQFADPTEPEVANIVCVGIAEAAAAAITKAISGSNVIPDVESASTIDREKPASHTATLIIMKDTSQYVFDWHTTLNINNPFIYTAEDWRQNRNGVMFTKFPGW